MHWDGDMWTEEKAPSLTPRRVLRPRRLAAASLLILLVAAIAVPVATVTAASSSSRQLLAEWSRRYSTSTVQESNSRLNYDGRWARTRSSGYLGGRARYSRQRGADVTLRFTGSAIAWIGPTGPGRGKARVYVNGVYKKTIDTHSRSFQASRVLFRMTWTRSATRTITIRVAGTRGRSKVAVDAFIVRGRARSSGTSNPGSPVAGARYIAPNGSDSNSGTKGSPWRSLYASIRKLRPGNTLYVRGGTYNFENENIIAARGTSSAPITIAAYPGETPVFRGVETQSIFMWFRNARYITVKGLTVYGDPSAPSRVSHGGAIFQYTGDTAGIRVEGNKLYGGAAWAQTMHAFYIGAGDVRSIVISRNYVDGRGGDGAGYHAYHDPNGRSILVSGNTFKNWDQCVMIWADTSGLTLRGNRLDHCRIGIRYHHSNGTRLESNTATSMSQSAIVRETRSNLFEAGNSWN